jgi:methyl-accepting chemotaxis protein
MQMICQAAEQQLQGIRQVNQSLETLNQLTIENARYADVNAKSSSQLSQQADDLLEATRQLCLWEGDSNEFSSSGSLTTEKER